MSLTSNAKQTKPIFKHVHTKFKKKKVFYPTRSPKLSNKDILKKNKNFESQSSSPPPRMQT